MSPHETTSPIEGPLRMMTVHAHPDDESSKGAATMARYVSEGDEVMVVTCTGGEAGSILNPAMDRPEVRANMPAIRREEMARAAEILGVQHRWLGFVDSGLPEGDPKPPLPEGCFALVDDEEAAAPLVALIREFRPHVLVTYDENGGYPHPDHIRTHEISMRRSRRRAIRTASRRRASRGSRSSSTTPTASPGRAWWPSTRRCWPGAWSRRTRSGWPTGRTTGPTPAPGSPRGCSAPSGSRCATARSSPTRRRSIPPAAGSSMPRDLQREIWPTEDYELVRSLVDTSVPEDDLFAGIDARVGGAVGR